MADGVASAHHSLNVWGAHLRNDARIVASDPLLWARGHGTRRAERDLGWDLQKLAR